MLLSIVRHVALSTSSFYPLERANPRLLDAGPIVFVSFRLVVLKLLRKVPSCAYLGSPGFLLSQSHSLPPLLLCFSQTL
jgi:hypothetical protein